MSVRLFPMVSSLKRVVNLFWLAVIVSSSAAQSYVQIGPEIEGAALGIQSGWSVSLSSDGKVIAIGARYEDSAGRDAGAVKVFRLQGMNWVQQGSDLLGSVPGESFGYSLDLTSAGNVLAVGAASGGAARIFEWDGSEWNQRGPELTGEQGAGFGSAVSLSESGDLVAISSPSDGTIGRRAGKVQVYQWNGSIWTQMGNDIYGSHTEDVFGASVSLSGDASSFIAGAVGDHGPLSTGLGTRSGYARVYEWDGAAWVKRGEDLEGDNSGDRFGAAVDLSMDGSVVSIGAPENDDSDHNAGHVKVLEWNGTDWIQRGASIEGVGSADYLGISVALSSSGDAVVIGSPLNDNQFRDSGSVRVLEWTGHNWVQRGDILQGESDGERFGWSVSISGDGSLIAAGAVFAAEQAGQTRTYQYSPSTGIGISEAGSLNTISPVFSDVFPNPFRESISIRLSTDLASPVRLSVVDLLGREASVLIDDTLQPGTHFVRWNGKDASGRTVSPGSYIILLRTNGGVNTRVVSLVR